MKNQITNRNIWGILIVTLGVIFLFDSLELINGYRIIHNFWPLAIILLGIVGLVKHTLGKAFSVVLIVTGLFYQLRYLEFIPYSMQLHKIYWPVIIIIIGIWMIFPNNKTYD